MTNLKFLVVLLLSILSLSSFAQGFLPEYTILHFGNGFSSLDDAITEDVNQMEMVGSTRKIQVVAQLASSSAGTAKRFHIQKDNDFRTITSPVVQDLGRVDMGDWKVLTDFVLWGMKNFPAKRYFVIIGGHGDGWKQRGSSARVPKNPVREISPDDNSRNAITTTQLGWAFETVRRLTGKQIDIFGADACLMASVEVATQLSPGVKFMVASQELEPGEGWIYQDFLMRLNRESDMSPRNIARLSARSYMEGYRKISSQYYRGMELTISASDLSEASKFASKLRKLTEVIKSTMTLQQLTELAKHSGGFYDRAYIDIGLFLNNLSKLPLNQAQSAVLKDVINSYETKVVVRDHSSMSYAFSTGLHIWAPGGEWEAKSYLPPYSELLFNKISGWGSLFAPYLK